MFYSVLNVIVDDHPMSRRQIVLKGCQEDDASTPHSDGQQASVKRIIIRKPNNHSANDTVDNSSIKRLRPESPRSHDQSPNVEFLETPSKRTRLIASPSQSTNRSPAALITPTHEPLIRSYSAPEQPNRCEENGYSNHEENANMSDLLSIRQAELDKQSIQQSKKQAELQLEAMRLHRLKEQLDSREQLLNDQSAELSTQTSNLHMDRDRLRQEYKTKMTELTTKRNGMMQSITQKFKQSVVEIMQSIQDLTNVLIQEPESIKAFPGPQPATDDDESIPSNDQSNCYTTNHAIQTDSQSLDASPPSTHQYQISEVFNQSSYPQHDIIEIDDSPIEPSSEKIPIHQSRPSSSNLSHHPSPTTTDVRQTKVIYDKPPSNDVEQSSSLSELQAIDEAVKLSSGSIVRQSSKPNINNSSSDRSSQNSQHRSIARDVDIRNKADVYRWLGQICPYDADCVPVIVEAILEHRHSSAIVTAALEPIKSMIDSADGIGFVKFAELKGMRCILKSINVHYKVHQFSMAAFTLISCIPLPLPPGRLILPALASDVLVKAAQCHPNTNDIMNGCLHLILLLLSQSEAGETFSLKGDLRFLDVTMSALKRYGVDTRPSSIKLVAKAIRTLFELLSNQNTQRDFLENQSGVVHLVSAMFEYPREMEIQLYGCRTMGTLLRRDMFQTHLALSSIPTINVLATALTLHGHDPHVGDAVMAIFACLPLTAEAKLRLVHHTSIVQSLLTLMDRSRESLRLELNGLRALVNLGYDNEQCVEQILNLGGIGVIDSLLAYYRDQDNDILVKLAREVMSLSLNGRSLSDFADHTQFEDTSSARRVVKLSKA